MVPQVTSSLSFSQKRRVRRKELLVKFPDNRTGWLNKAARNKQVRIASASAVDLPGARYT